MARCLPIGAPVTRRLRKAFEYAGCESSDRLVSYFFWLNPQAAGALLAPDHRACLTSGSVTAPLLSALQRLPKEASRLDRILYLEGKFFLADHNLNYTDKMSMSQGVEVRVPLLDPDLVALAARLPDNLKQRGRCGKWVFKKAMESDLPRDVIYRPKTGFGAPLRRWLRRELRPLVEDVLSHETIMRRGLFDPDAVARMVRMDREGKIDAAYTIFALLCIELWCRIFLDRSGRL